MRSYGQSSASKRGKKQEYRTRSSTEWDVRCTLHTLNHDQEVQDIQESIELNASRLQYALIGGQEYNSNEHTHVHIALIFKQPQSRHAVLLMLHREHIKNEYCSPRNPNYSYLGWKLHHCKYESKLNDTHCIYEYGQLPNEQLTLQQWKTCTKYGYAGSKPTVQSKLNVVIKQSVPQVDKRKGDRHKVKQDRHLHRKKPPTTEPRIRKQDATKNIHQAVRTPAAIDRARLRLIKYNQLLEESDCVQEQARLRTIIEAINNDYFN